MITRIGYMDKVDFEEELGKAADGNLIFPSVATLRKARPCTKECGIVKVKITLEKVIKDTNYPTLKKQNLRKNRK